jgi:hypothetical protein
MTTTTTTSTPFIVSGSIDFNALRLAFPQASSTNSPTQQPGTQQIPIILQFPPSTPDFDWQSFLANSPDNKENK